MASSRETRPTHRRRKLFGAPHLKILSGCRRQMASCSRLCGDDVDNALFSEVLFQDFLPRGSYFVAFKRFLDRFLEGCGVRPLGPTRQKDPRTTSQLDVSLPMSGRPPAGPIATISHASTKSSKRLGGRVSRDEDRADGRRLRSFELPGTGGVSLAKNAPEPSDPEGGV